MNIIMSKLIRDVVMHWIYIEVWFTAKPYFYIYLKWGMVYSKLSMAYCKRDFYCLLRPISYKHLSILKFNNIYQQVELKKKSTPEYADGN